MNRADALPREVIEARSHGAPPGRDPCGAVQSEDHCERRQDHGHVRGPSRPGPPPSCERHVEHSGEQDREPRGLVREDAEDVEEERSSVPQPSMGAAKPVRCDQETGEVETIDFGHVGDIVEINVRLLSLLLENGYVPVISSLGADEQGNIYNINADTIAAEIAVHLQAEKLILLTDVDGILRDREDLTSRISRLSADEAERLVRERVVSSGMLPKIAAIAHLIRRGVRSAHIINGSKRNALLHEVFTDEGAGTMITD